MYCGSEGYLERVRAGTWRVDLEGKPAGMVTADDERHAKEKRVATNAKRDKKPAVPIPQATSTAHSPAPAPKEGSNPRPKRLSLADLREAARRRREGVS